MFDLRRTGGLDGDPSLVLEVVLQSLRQRQRLDVVDALSAQSQAGRPPAQVHQGEGLRCRGERDGVNVWMWMKPRHVSTIQAFLDSNI